MIEFTKNGWGQRDIIQELKINKTRYIYDTCRHSDKKSEICPSTTTLKHSNALDKVNKLSSVRLPYMTPYDDYSIKIHVQTVTLADISQNQKE